MGLKKIFLLFSSCDFMRNFQRRILQRIEVQKEIKGHEKYGKKEEPDLDNILLIFKLVFHYLILSFRIFNYCFRIKIRISLNFR